MKSWDTSNIPKKRRGSQRAEDHTIKCLPDSGLNGSEPSRTRSASLRLIMNKLWFSTNSSLALVSSKVANHDAFIETCLCQWGNHKLSASGSPSVQAMHARRKRCVRWILLVLSTFHSQQWNVVGRGNCMPCHWSKSALQAQLQVRQSCYWHLTV